MSSILLDSSSLKNHSFSDVKIPDCSKSIFDNVQSIIGSLNNVSSDSNELHSSRSRLYVYLNRLQRDLIPSSLPNFEDDTALTRAEQVAKQSLFSQYPGSEMRLLPLANDYLEHFHELEKCVQKDSDYDASRFIKVVQDLGKSHTAFVNAYSTEVRQVCKYQPDMVRISHEMDIEFFTLAFLNSTKECSTEELGDLIEKVADGEIEFVSKFYFLALEHALQMNGESQPQLFVQFKDQFDELNKLYQKLPLEERKLLHSHLIGKEQVLSEETKIVLETIRTRSYHWQRDPLQSQLYSAMLQSVYSSVSKSLSLAMCLEIAFVDLPEECTLNPQRLYEILFYSGLHLDDEKDEIFDFFKREDISRLKEKFQGFSFEEKDKIKLAVLGVDYLETKSEVGQLMRDIDYHSNRLAFSKESDLLVKIFQIITSKIQAKSLVFEPSNPSQSKGQSLSVEVLEEKKQSATLAQNPTRIAQLLSKILLLFR